jgi:hypothetical protein
MAIPVIARPQRGRGNPSFPVETDGFPQKMPPVRRHFLRNDGGGLHFETVPFSFFAEFQSISPISDGRRMMDKEMGWFHPCSSWPLTDLKIKIPIL